MKLGCGWFRSGNIAVSRCCLWACAGGCLLEVSRSHGTIHQPVNAHHQVPSRGRQTRQRRSSNHASSICLGDGTLSIPLSPCSTNTKPGTRHACLCPPMYPATPHRKHHKPCTQRGRFRNYVHYSLNQSLHVIALHQIHLQSVITLEQKVNPQSAVTDHSYNARREKPKPKFRVKNRNALQPPPRSPSLLRSNAATSARSCRVLSLSLQFRPTTITRQHKRFA